MNSFGIHQGNQWINLYGKWAEIISTPKTEPMKDRTITAQQAQSIIDVACETWKENLAVSWGGRICQKKNIVISERFYQEMRSACIEEQHTLFDSIFGKDKKEFTSDDLKAGEIIKGESGLHFLKTNYEFVCIETGVYGPMSRFTGKKVKITNIEFEEVNE